jgi:inner membrane protein
VSAGARIARTDLLAAALLCVIAAADVLVAALDPPVGLLLGVLDEPAHLATTGLVLLALPHVSRPFAGAALVASVAIDIDHLPLELGSDFLTAGTTRPYTHSLLGAVVIAVLVLAATRRRPIAAGVLVGLLAHFLRDLATGNGVALAWPLTDGSARFPYVVYFAIVTLLALRAALSLRR